MKRILVIEDDPDVRGLITETLGLREWEVLNASNGAEGAAAALRELPDLILCDIQMPQKDGFQVLKELRENPATATTPFVFLTGLNEKPGMRQAMELGADDYIAKPFTVKELLSAVEARFRKEELLEQKRDELRENLTFALPHELVTPLNSILGFSNLILDSTASAEVKEFATHIREAGDRLHNLIEKFLFYAKVEVAAADPDQRTAAASGPLNETSEAVIQASERAAQKFGRRADLQLEVTPAPHPIQTTHLLRAAQELLENAFRFSEPGTRVEVQSSVENGSLRFSVRDRGRGMSTEQIRKAGAHLQFDRQIQEQQGTGLGLAICRRIAQLYGGALDLESTLNEGTRATFRLPA